jgi:hypothetical protein
LHQNWQRSPLPSNANGNGGPTPARPTLQADSPASLPFNPINRLKHLYAPKAVKRTEEISLQPSVAEETAPGLNRRRTAGESLTRRVSGHIKNLATQRASSWNEFAFAYSQGWFDPLRTPLFPESALEHLPAQAPSTPRLAAVDRTVPIPRAQSAPPSQFAGRHDAEPDLTYESEADDEVPETTPIPPAKPPPSHGRSFSSDLAVPVPPARRPQILKLGYYPNIRHLHEVRPFYERHKFLPAPLPQHEPERLKSLYSFNILYKTDDLNFHQVVHMIKLVFNSSMAFCSLLDSEANWYKSYSGLGYTVNEMRRGVGFCAHVVLTNSDEPFVVLDATKDWRFKNNPLVKGHPHLRFYAGAPLRTSDGYNLGSLAVADDKPRTEFSPRARHIL